MSVTAKEAVDAALKLMCHVNENGEIDASKEARFYSIAPAYVTLLQYELADLENAEKPEPCVELSQALAISDDAALKTLPCGLAMYFSLVDRDSELYNHFSEEFYKRSAASVKADEVKLEEKYLSLNDPMMRC